MSTTCLAVLVRNRILCVGAHAGRTDFVDDLPALGYRLFRRDVTIFEFSSEALDDRFGRLLKVGDHVEFVF